jgi:hypothetical protein
MEKAEFEYERNVIHPGSPHVLFRIEAPGDYRGSSGHPRRYQV